ncbi:type IV pilus modification protein PilV [Hahella sp. KA22]|uniref:type IV pilus modification protein PilV n=1 Tax=Hahella sp. KA22 TaxID=1628392 RepID=UPI000FDF2482|nr:type IV pilus modification protein PilV [Hahella sp. KA22]AZZ94363.1 type IV pilus modification protein PilV [Hahella sp. KA22]QAY57737.1 type IV pilus modification protein PilV [Hahella sp. KA22]
MNIRSPSSRQSGFTMIEILVAVVILAIGLLGVAGLQTLSVKASTNSSARSQAIYLANDMADRIRANLQGRKDSNYDAITGDAKKAACLTSTGCSAADMAANDKAEWLEELSNRLPNGKGELKHTGNLYTITITWDERVKQGADKDDANVALQQATLSYTFYP